MNVCEKDILEILSKGSMVGKYQSHEVYPMSDKPIGYLADHFILKLKTSRESREFFLKAVPINVEKRTEYLDETGFFTREVQIYETLIPILLSGSSLSWAPECYVARDEHYIIMEILNDYKNKSTKDLVLDFEHLKIASSTLAVFHASSLIYEENCETEIAGKFLGMLKENAYPQIEGHVRQKGLENAIEVLMELIKLIPKYENSINEILRKFPETLRKIYKFVEPSTTFKNVISHGDLWVNNIMFAYDDEKPTTCKFIDFQLARYAPPAFDLAQLIFINSTTETRAQHLDDVLNTYCDSFESELKRAGIESSILPSTEILQTFKGFHLAGLIEAALFGHLTLLPSTLSTSIMSSSEEYNKFINESRIKTCLKAFEEDYYKDRLTEILSEIIDEFILKN